MRRKSFRLMSLHMNSFNRCKTSLESLHNQKYSLKIWLKYNLPRKNSIRKETIQLTSIISSRADFRFCPDLLEDRRALVIPTADVQIDSLVKRSNKI